MYDTHCCLSTEQTDQPEQNNIIARTFKSISFHVMLYTDWRPDVAYFVFKFGYAIYLEHYSRIC